MSEKVRITRDQAETIDTFRKTVQRMGVSASELKDVFVNGYEVEPEFKVGEKIIDTLVNDCPIIEITEIDGDYLLGTWTMESGNKAGTAVEIHRARHATPSEIAAEKERKFFARHGREPWELREGDLLEYLGDMYIIDCFDSEKVCLKSGLVRKSNYEESFDYVKKHFTIVCFAENRLDVSKCLTT